MGDVLTEGAGERAGESVALNETAENTTMPLEESLSHQFIGSVYAQGISGVFVWTALIVTSFQVLDECVYNILIECM